MPPAQPTNWHALLAIFFCVGVMVYGWATIYWPSARRGQLSLRSLFVLTLFVAVGVGVPLILLRFQAIDTN
jgi:Tfp pilus assembly protein PilN